MKSWISLLLSAAMLFSLCACSNPLGKTEATEASTTAATTETVPEPTEYILEERIVDGRSRCSAVYQYNDKEQLIRIDRTHDKDGSIYNYEIYEYNEDGSIAKEEKWINDELPILRTSYEYDEQGVLVRINNEKVHDAVWNWYAVSYDSNGRVEKYTVNEETGRETICVGEILFQYDSQGQLIRREEYNKEQVMLCSIDYTYDELGQLIQVETCTMDSNFDTRTVDIYEYNEEGQCITKIHEIYSDELPFSTVKTAYIWGILE